MKRICTLLGICFYFTSIAQNVGIGTTVPAAKLQINHRSTATPGLQLVDSAASAGGSVRFRNVNNSVGINVSGYNSSNFNKDQYLDITSDTAFITTFRGDGNVGIRRATPAFPLDVNGDINTNGALRANGNAGSDGQFLKSNGDGTMMWQDLCDYKNITTFRVIGAGNWTVPAGITKIMVEAWGAGAGGTAYAGGGGGGYISGFFTVTPGNIITFIIGDGGAGAHDNGNAGEATTVTIPSGTTLSATGGGAPYYLASFLAVSGAGGGGYNSSAVGFNNYYGAWGKSGLVGVSTFVQSGPSIFHESFSGANGGDGAKSSNTGGIGALYLYNITAAAKVRTMSMGNGRQPGGGGGGGYYLVSVVSFASGQSGGDGMVIIHY